MKAIKRTIFGVCKEYVGVGKVVLPLRGFRVDMMAVTEFYLNFGDCLMHHRLLVVIALYM